MKVSEYYQLGRRQPTLDFVDVDIDTDVALFVDPYALRHLPTDWGIECVSMVKDFFQTVIDHIRHERHQEAINLLAALKEPNEIRLGLSQGRPHGRALGPQSATKTWDALCRSDAVQSGLIEDLEDTILLIEGISSDIVSDITTNIIRAPLIHYTVEKANLYGIPLETGVRSGPLWDPKTKSWFQELVSLPMPENERLILVPKAIVRHRMEYDCNDYYTNYILENLCGIEMKANSELIRLLKNGNRTISKKDLSAKYGKGKAFIIEQTRLHPELLQQYRHDKASHSRPLLDHDDFAGIEGTESIDWDELLQNLKNVAVGRDDASNFEKSVESLLSALFYPALVDPKPQTKIHDGRKRIDLVYTNVAQEGFFRWLGFNYRAPYMYVECKNYSGDPANPELDQLSGRFSPDRGKVGLLVCRKIENKTLFLKRCIDTATDDRGWIIPLDDDDLVQLVEERKKESSKLTFSLLMERFERLVMRNAVQVGEEPVLAELDLIQLQIDPLNIELDPLDLEIAPLDLTMTPLVDELAIIPESLDREPGSEP